MNQSKSYKILVVEDEGIVALDEIQHLESLGYTVTGHASTAEEAIALAASTKPDLIMMDINLGGKRDGIEAAEEITKLQNTPIIFVTAHAEEETLRRAKSVRPFGYIIKPFEQDELRATIEMAFSRLGLAAESVEEEEVTFEQAESLAALPNNLKKIGLFSGLTSAQLEELASHCTIKSLDADNLLVEPEQKQVNPFIILKGRMNLSRISTTGRELVIDLLLPGDIYGVLTSLNHQVSQSQIKTVSECEICLLPTSYIRNYATTEPAFMQKISEDLTRRYEQAISLAVGLAHSRVEARIISTLINLAPRMGKNSGPTDSLKATPVRLFITRREVADLTGTTPETAIRVTKALEREGYLDLTRPGIIKIPELAKLTARLNKNLE